MGVRMCMGTSLCVNLLHSLYARERGWDQGFVSRLFQQHTAATTRVRQARVTLTRDCGCDMRDSDYGWAVSAHACAGRASWNRDGRIGAGTDTVSASAR